MLRTPHLLHWTLCSSAACLALPLGAQTLFEKRPVKQEGLLIPAGAFAAVDVDLDGDDDLVADKRLYLNDGSGGFTDVSSTHMPPSPGAVIQIEVVDVDGDGDPDLVLAVYSSSGGGRISHFPEQNLLYRNDGSGVFTDATATSLPTVIDNTTSVVCADLDADGDLDVVFGNVVNLVSSVDSRVCLNLGGGRFVDLPPGRLPSGGVWQPWHATDIDRDGDVDLLTAWANALGDVDGDGDLDLAIASYWLPPHQFEAGLLLNDGRGVFTDVSATQLPLWSHGLCTDVQLVDLDGDGALDLVYATDAGNALFRNDGTGNFTDATAGQMPAASGNTTAMSVGDVDEDGDLDLVVSRFGGPFVLLNNGAGSFTDCTSAILPGSQPFVRAVSLDDLDGDGDLDLTLSSAYDFPGLGCGGTCPLSTGLHLYTNLARHLEAPKLALSGNSYDLQLFARGALPGQTTLVLPVLAPRTAYVPVPPYGVFGLDPASSVSLPAVAIPQPAGETTLRIAVPTSPSLLGVPVHTQALIARLPGSAHLTDVVHDVILR